MVFVVAVVYESVMDGFDEGERWSGCGGRCRCCGRVAKSREMEDVIGWWVHSLG